MSLWGRLTASRAEQEAEELRLAAAAEQSTPLASCGHGQVATVSGTVRAITVRPKHETPALEAEVYDGSAAVRVVWLGRRRIPGIDPGRRITLHGRITRPDDVMTMYNPRYELKPST